MKALGWIAVGAVALFALLLATAPPEQTIAEACESKFAFAGLDKIRECEFVATASRALQAADRSAAAEAQAMQDIAHGAR